MGTTMKRTLTAKMTLLGGAAALALGAAACDPDDLDTDPAQDDLLEDDLLEDDLFEDEDL
ncbi:MAG: hypothetical protein ACNA8R_11540 [Nitriliruptoraceae bacterium]